MLGQTLKVFKALNSDAKPWQLSLGIVFGAFLGLTPLLSLHNAVLLFLAFVITLNIGLMLLSFAFFSGVAYLLDPLFHKIGYAVLTKDSLHGFWTNFFSSPLAVLGNLNNSIVMGSLIFSAILAVPLFLVSNVLVSKYRQNIQGFLDRIPLIRSLKIVRAYQAVGGN